VAVLTLPDVVRLKAMISGQVIGFIAGDIRRKDHLGWITTLAVLPEYCRQGIAMDLLMITEQRMGMPWVRLCVRKSNRGAIHLYERAGYTQFAIWPSYYHDREDALVLEKRVKIDQAATAD
jgi:ribosomal protein S18 acetylase RimI-like enzyme